MNPEPAPPSRRELNKSATRLGIARATLELVRSNGPGNFTADDVAARAEVSRRTFFNYFPSIEAALTVAMEEFLDGVLGHFESRPAGEPIVESMLQALSQPADPDRLAVMAELYGLAESTPEMMRFHLEAWDRAERQIVGSIMARTGEPADSLYVTSLVGSVLSCGRSALAEWLRRTGGTINPETLQQLEELFAEVIGYLRNGFNN
ncbi:TetR/AcrR family transcriptional regulator [Arthrobacter jiangjiafuii]|uniref:TetR/AcrR family transcriptional regulator n=1 Tax=Arthrobacter jiangjiafuii TaxID=2817475 RepID=A0A975R0J5_9MICC|nr:TetR family transcriptional regulator [Arthrobacter jiangjiafuii]MBP3042691.1 TetR family transcriptional regulator [Arthrobacter jiangjiafuii]QWC09588.1 TetR/AcrR family transcriptional regulator [Arthrobacter jiangjiafuii]